MSSPPPAPPPLDPAILAADNDPSLSFLQRASLVVNAQEAACLAATTKDDLDDLNATGDPEDTSATMPTTMVPLMPLEHLGPRVIKKKKLSHQSLGDFLEFSKTSIPGEHELMFMVTLLQTWDLMNHIIADGVEHWKVTDELKKTLINYSKALICSSTITSYASDCEKYILTALRMNHVKDLPSSDDLISTRALVSEISWQLSVAHNWIKKKIQESVKKSRYSKKIRNIGALAAAIIGTYPFPATVVFYMRVAYIRWHVVHGNHEAQDFWPNVNVGLEKLRAEGDLKFVIALDICYKDNIKKYGDPAVSGFSSGELDSSTDNWV